MCKSRCSRKQISRRQVLNTGGKAMLGVSLASGLIGSRQPNPTAAAQEGGAAEVTWWVQQDPEMDFREEYIIAPFEEQNSGIDVVMEAVPGQDIDRVVATALQAGAGPDILPSTGPSPTSVLAAAGLLMNLDPFAEEHGWQELLLPWALATGRIDGGLYQIPHELESTMLFYGEQQFAENGWTVPTTRQEFEDVATEAVGKGILPVAAGIGDCNACSGWLSTIFFNHYSGPDAIYQALTGEISFADPVFVEAIELLNQYMQAGWIGGSAEQYFSTSEDTVHAQIANGEAMMTMEGTWLLNDLSHFFGPEAGNDNVWGWAQNPSFREGVPYPLFPIGIGSTLAVAAASEFPDETLQFLNWYYSDPVRIAQRIADGGIRFVLPILYQESDFPETMDPRVAEILTTMSQATSTGNFGYTHWTFLPPKSTIYVQDEIQSVFASQLSPADYCAGLAAQFAQEADEGLVPPVIPREIA